ncbi:MAG: thioredoxin domain-containing protein [Anaerolineales bacterium]|nr:hypothetical protein [Anaerolineales bacterium]NUQ84772.1 thioredoxin domain-containing protein [Anaerolineales bacterium]
MEGKFYVWTLDEIREVLKDDSEFFEAAYGIVVHGNWEGKTILQRALDDASLAARFKLDPETVPAKLTDCRARLLSVRNSRIRPGTDDKILASWNGLMLATIAEASQVLDSRSLLPTADQQDGRCQILAARNAEFLLKELRPGGKLKHSWRGGKAINEVFLRITPRRYWDCSNSIKPTSTTNGLPPQRN